VSIGNDGIHQPQPTQQGSNRRANTDVSRSMESTGIDIVIVNVIIAGSA
jgi:hypothetical protein